MADKNDNIRIVKQLYSEFRELNINSKLILEVLEYEDGARIAVLSKKGNRSKNLNPSLYLSYSGILLLKEFLNSVDITALEVLMKKKDVTNVS